jgi:hypothetical protein
MKFNLLLIAALCVLGSSCTKDLDLTPASSATAQVFYGSVNDFQQAASAVYSGLQTYPNRVLDLYETRSDNIYGASDDGKRYWTPSTTYHRTWLISRSSLPPGPTTITASSKPIPCWNN